MVPAGLRCDCGIFICCWWAVGTAWGYAWGGCDWHGGNVKVNVNQNININNTHINRQNYQQKSSGPRDQYERQLAA